MNVASALSEQARARPGAAALVLPGGRTVSYRDLDDDSGRIARGLVALGVEPGTRVALLVPPGPDFFPLAFGIFKAAAVPVVVDPGMGLARMGACLAEAAPAVYVGTAKSHLARLLLGLGGGAVRLRVGVGPTFGLGGVSLDEVRRRGGEGSSEARPVAPEDAAAILFTSGSTGPPRGAIYSHGNFAAQVESVRRTFGIEPGEVDLPTFPLFALFDPALGMTTVVPDMDPARPARASPGRIAAQIRQHGVTTMFASPGLLDPLSRWCRDEGVKLPSLRRVITAGAPVAPRIVEAMAAALPEGALLHTPYGATEALPVASIDHRAILGETRARAAAGEGICVGLPVEGIEIRCIRVTDEPIFEWTADLEVPRGTPGEIAVRGPQVTRRYFARPDADALAKIAHPGGGFWHRMGDVGRLDGEGRVWFLGRKSQRVRTAEGDLYPDQCEAVFNDACGELGRTALVGLGEPGRQRPILCAEQFEVSHPVGEPDLRRALLAAGARVEATRRIRDVQLHRGGFPVDARHNAKIQRERLAAWAAKRVRPA